MQLEIARAIALSYPKDEDGYDLAKELAADAMRRLASYRFDPHVLHASDLGKCKRMVWARIHGANSIPTSWETRLKYFDFGAQYGALMAARLAVGLAKIDLRFAVELEPELHYRGVVGHTDALVSYDGIPIAAVENKTNMNTDPPQAPDKRGAFYQVFQAGLSALAKQTPNFYVFTLGPAVTNHRVKGEFQKSTIYDQAEYVTADWRERIDADIDRLQAALGDTPPDYDPPQAWWCRTCQAGACPKNVNPDKQKELVV